MAETLTNGYSYESTRRDLSNEYQHDRFQMFFENRWVCVLWTKVAFALGGLRRGLWHSCRKQTYISSLQALHFVYINPYNAAGDYFGQKRWCKKKRKNGWNPNKWVLIWEYSARSFQWIPTWQGSYVFQKYFVCVCCVCLCALDKGSHGSGRVKRDVWHSCRKQAYVSSLRPPALCVR